MKIATLDFETDPFDHGIRPEAFDVGFYDGETHKEIWHPDCANLIVDYILSLEEPHLIYAHNGGKFDFFFFLERIAKEEKPIKIVRGRILEARIGKHILRDSYAILPVPLRAYEKDDIDYNKLYKDVREKHKEEIQKYRRQDCKGLHELVSRFRERFGDALTIGTAAQKELKKLHPFKPAKEAFDNKFRKFFYGGRVQCFEGGIVDGEFYVYDVNSMYPAAMRNYYHPIGTAHVIGNRITDKTMFARVIAKNSGALPYRDPETGNLSFDLKRGEFYASIHEINAGLETGTLEIEKVIAAYDFEQVTKFDSFVDYYYGLRVAANKQKDIDKMAKIDYMLFKLVLNSAYGKFAMDSRDFCDSLILPVDSYIPTPLCKCAALRCECKELGLAKDDEGAPSFGWRRGDTNGYYQIWEKRIDRPYFYNVAIAASITGAARATLLRGLSNAQRPIYCDTDSIICERLTENIDPHILGAWKEEATGDRVAIGGKKMYAVFKDGECIKQASKGGNLTPDEIVAVSRGTKVRWVSEAPNFKLDGSAAFVSRDIVSTLPKEYGSVRPLRNPLDELRAA
jgi:DNA polymerase elongation subunit (family B)